MRAKDLVGIDDSSVAKVEHLLQGRCKGSWSLNVVKRRGEQFILLMNVVKVKHSNSKPKDTLPAADVVRSEPGEISGQLEEIQRKLDILLQRYLELLCRTKFHTNLLQGLTSRMVVLLEPHLLLP